MLPKFAAPELLPNLFSVCGFEFKFETFGPPIPYEDWLFPSPLLPENWLLPRAPRPVDD